MSAKRRVWIGWALLGALLVPRLATAEPAARYAIRWSTATGAESCAQQAEMTAAVGRLVSADLLAPAERADRFVVGSASRSGVWRAEFSVQDAVGNHLGERQIESSAESCSELDAATALAIALIVDPARGLASAQTAAGATPSSSVPEPAARPSPNAAPRAPSLLESAPRPAAREASAAPEPRFVPTRSIQADFAVLAGVLPEPAPGTELELWLPIAARHSLRAAVGYFAPQTRQVSQSAANATFYVGTARLAYCPLLAAPARGTSVFGCAGLASGLLVASGHHGGYSNTPARGLLSLDGALTVDRTLVGPWALSFTAGGGLTPFRPQFLYQGATGTVSVYRRSFYEGRLEIGLGYRF